MQEWRNYSYAKIPYLKWVEPMNSFGKTQVITSKKNRAIILILVCLGLSTFFTCTSLLQAASMDIPEKILMDHARGKVDNPLYAPVCMPHKLHVSNNCQSCHHTWDDESQSPRKCSHPGCHDLIGATGAQIQEVRAAYNAYHNRESDFSCLGCHIEKSKQGKAHGPFQNCAECHPQK